MKNQNIENNANRQNVVSIESWKKTRRLTTTGQTNELQQPTFTAEVVILLAVPFFITSLFGVLSFLTVAYAISLTIAVALVRFNLIHRKPLIENYFRTHLVPEVTTINDIELKKAA